MKVEETGPEVVTSGPVLFKSLQTLSGKLEQ